jgi:putative SOS response-associated peptidase YedK
MCGRYASTKSSDYLVSLFEALDESDGAIVADYNIAPTDPVPVVRTTRRPEAAPSGGRVLSVARWGLVPPWASSPAGAARMINARAESVATSKAYAQSFAQRRCLIPADGWYEWRRSATGRQPYFMSASDGSLLAFAGLWSTWGTGPSRLLSCSILTVAAAGALAAVHDRMPLVLPPSLWARWLSPGDASGLLTGGGEEYAAGIAVRPVGPAVGDVRNDGPELIREVPAAPAEPPRPSIVDDQPLTLF